MNTNFKVIGLTGLRIKPESTAPEAYTQHSYLWAIRAVSDVGYHARRVDVVRQNVIELAIMNRPDYQYMQEYGVKLQAAVA